MRLLPKESGVALMGFGIVGVLLLDPADIFLVLSGALALTPRLFRRSERWMQVRFPRIHREGRRHLDRSLDDFERRYPPDHRVAATAMRGVSCAASPRKEASCSGQLSEAQSVR